MKSTSPVEYLITKQAFHINLQQNDYIYISMTSPQWEHNIKEPFII